MRISLIIILLSTFTLAQSVEITAVSHSIISGFTISEMMKDRSAYGKGDPVYREHQKRWRLLLPLEYLSAAGVGVSIALENEKILMKSPYCKTYIDAMRNRDKTHNVIVTENIKREIKQLEKKG